MPLAVAPPRPRTSTESWIGGPASCDMSSLPQYLYKHKLCKIWVMTQLTAPPTFDSLHLTALAAELIAVARTASSGRSARTIHGGRDHVLRQTLLTLAAGRGLDEHESPGEATLQVLVGRVRLSVGGQRWEGAAGDLLTIPPHRHSLEAVDDSAILLTVVAGRR